jgi:hypothetical protein
MILTAPIEKFKPVIAMTSAKKRGIPPGGVSVGVIKNNKIDFPNFSAQGLASVFEYGTVERFRKIKTMGIITGGASTGKVTPRPWLRKAVDDTIDSYARDFLRESDKLVEGK